MNARVGNGPRKKVQRVMTRWVGARRLVAQRLVVRRLVVQRLVTLLAAGLLAAALSACTGTKEPQPPTLLVVGVEDRSAPPAVPQLLLVEDVTATAPVGDPRLRVVPGSRRALLAPAVAIDFEERDGARDAAWVLTRAIDASGPTPVVTAHLQRFEVADVDPAAPTAFAEDAAALVTLTDPGGTGVLDGVSDSSPATCPTALQVSRSGSHAVILDDPEACGLTDHPELWLVDTGSGDAMTLEGTNDVLPLPPYANQNPSNERVVFLVAGIGSAHVYQDAFDGASSRVQTLAFGTDLITDVAGSGALLFALTGTELRSLDLSDPAAEEVRADTRGSADRLATDPSGVVTQVLVVADEGMSVHQDREDEQPDNVLYGAAGATIDPGTRFAYAVAEERIVILDLLTGGDSGDALRALPVTLPEVTLPSVADAEIGVIAWIRALPPVATP